jgi:hypothetical protein
MLPKVLYALYRGVGWTPSRNPIEIGWSFKANASGFALRSIQGRNNEMILS